MKRIAERGQDVFDMAIQESGSVLYSGEFEYEAQQLSVSFDTLEIPERDDVAALLANVGYTPDIGDYYQTTRQRVNSQDFAIDNQLNFVSSNNHQSILYNEND